MSKRFLNYFLRAAAILVVLAVLSPYILYLIYICPFLPRGLRFLAARGHDILLASSYNRQIDFYGKVIDQNGDPIPDATVQIQFSLASTEEMLNNDDLKTHYSSTHSNVEGKAEVHLKGRHIAVAEAKKNGYLAGSFPPAIYQWYIDSPTPHIPTDPAHPFIIRMWKIIGDPEPLVNVGLSLRGGDPMNQPRAIYSVYLTGQFYSPYVKRGQRPDADLWLKFEPSTVPPTETDVVGIIIYTFEVPHGGIIRTADPYPYYAPEGGYEEKLTFEAVGYRDISKNTTQWFYLKARNGQLYAAITAGLRGLANPNASRNLQPGGGFLDPTDLHPLPK